MSVCGPYSNRSPTRRGRTQRTVRRRPLSGGKWSAGQGSPIVGDGRGQPIHGLLRYRSGRSPHWIKSKNPNAPAVKRETEEDWGR
jgi:hypothetical protein